MSLPRMLQLLRTQRGLRRREWQSPDAYRDLVHRRLREVVRVAARVPYYRDHFADAGLDPMAVRAPEDLHALPITTNRTLRDLPREAVTVEGSDFDALYDKWSSGSTGVTLHTWVTPHERDVQALNALRVFHAGGYRRRDVLLDLLEPYAPKPRAIERLGLYRKHYIELKEDLADHTDRINRMRPDVVLASATLLDLLCDHAESGALTARPRLVFNTGERIGPRQRARVEASLGTAPIDVYGASEFGPIAFQCAERDGYHINADGLIVDVVDPATGDPVPVGTVGQVVVTGLLGRVMPFIRYSVGDLAALRPGRCACGRGLPLLESVHGRLIDMLFTVDGTKVSPWGPTIVLEETPGVDRFQLVQDAPGALLVRIEGGPVDEADVTARLRALLGQTLAVRFEYPESLTAGGRHKFRLVVNRCAPSTTGG